MDGVRVGGGIERDKKVGLSFEVVNGRSAESLIPKIKR